MIRVEISSIEYAMQKHWQFWEMYCIQKLREAGIPAIGIFYFGGVKHGIIQTMPSIENDSIVFQWEGEE